MSSLDNHLKGGGTSYHQNRMADKMLKKRVIKGRSELLKKGISQRHADTLVSGVRSSKEWQGRQKQLNSVIDDKGAARLAKILRLKSISSQRDIVFGDK